MHTLMKELDEKPLTSRRILSHHMVYKLCLVCEHTTTGHTRKYFLSCMTSAMLLQLVVVYGCKVTP